MCDYSLHLVASRPAKVGDQLVSTKASTRTRTSPRPAIGSGASTIGKSMLAEVAIRQVIDVARCVHASLHRIGSAANYPGNS